MSDLKIEKMVYGGDGLARLAGDSGKSKAVFIPFVLAGEEVKAHVAERGRGFARATLESEVQPSAHRIEAKCPYFQRCGGCHYQHADYAHQLEIKVGILRETLLRTAKFEWNGEIPTHSAEPWNYRNRTRMKVRSGADDFAIGYYKLATHQLLAVEECPISSPLINRMLAAIWKLGKSGGIPKEIAEIEFFANADDSQILLELYLGGEHDDSSLNGFAKALRSEVPAVAGLTAFFGAPDRPANKVWSEGAGEISYRTATDEYHVRAGSFFQTNRSLTDALVNLVTAEQSGETALDLYAGTGLFSLPLARAFNKVIAVESGPESYADLRTNAPANVECHRSTTEDFLKRATKLVPELVVTDPPRAGLGEKVTAALTKMATQNITYVSCDPATMARDLRELVMGGYKVKSIDLIDLFPQTFHIETVVRLSR